MKEPVGRFIYSPSDTEEKHPIAVVITQTLTLDEFEGFKKDAWWSKPKSPVKPIFPALPWVDKWLSDFKLLHNDAHNTSCQKVVTFMWPGDQLTSRIAEHLETIAKVLLYSVKLIVEGHPERGQVAGFVERTGRLPNEGDDKYVRVVFDCGHVIHFEPAAGEFPPRLTSYVGLLVDRKIGKLYP
jgi:hypothetical protein